MTITFGELLDGLENAKAIAKKYPGPSILCNMARRRVAHYETLLNAWLWRYGG